MLVEDNSLKKTTIELSSGGVETTTRYALDFTATKTERQTNCVLKPDTYIY